MLILTSNGLSTPELIKGAKGLIKGDKAALVVTADSEYKEKNYHVLRLKAELESLGFTVDIFDFDNKKPEDLIEYDIVEMIGGNPFYLLNSIKTNGFADVLRDFVRSKCIIGCSAGSFVLTPSIGLANLYTPEMNTVGLKDFTALSFTETQVLPHYSKFKNRFEHFEEKCLEYEKKNKCKVIRLDDGEAVVIEKVEVWE